MLTKVEICNIALSHLGVAKEIAEFDNERSAEAMACRRFWDINLDTVLRAWHWPFATAYQNLSLVQERPTIEWLFSYRYPVDCIDARRIVSGNPRDNAQTQIPMKIAQDSSGLLLFTNMQNAQLEYTLRAELYNFWPHDFVLAFSSHLAFLISPRLTANDQNKRTEMAQAYQVYLSQAQKNAYNEQIQHLPPQAESIRFREGEIDYGPY